MTDSTPPLVIEAATQLVNTMAWWTGHVDRLDPGRAHGPISPSRLASAAEQIVWGLVDDDDHIRAESLISLVPWLGPADMPVDESWWSTPLGLLATAAQQPDEARWVTMTEAADVMGVDRSTVWRWVRDGKLTSVEGGPTGGHLVSAAETARIAAGQ